MLQRDRESCSRLSSLFSQYKKIHRLQIYHIRSSPKSTSFATYPQSPTNTAAHNCSLPRGLGWPFAMASAPKTGTVPVKEIQQSRKKRRASDENTSRQTKRGRLETRKPFANFHEPGDALMQNSAATKDGFAEPTIITDTPTLNTVTAFSDSKANEETHPQNPGPFELGKPSADNVEPKGTTMWNSTATESDKPKPSSVTYTPELSKEITSPNRKADDETHPQITSRSDQGKSSAGNDEPGDIVMTDSTATGPAQSDCCVNCAKYYSLYPSLMCCRPMASEAPCLLCLAANRKACVTVKPSVRRYLDALQKAAQTYLDVPTSENRRDLENQQKRFDRKLQNRRRHPENVVNSVNEEALEKFSLHRILTQQTQVSANLSMLRRLPLQRTTFSMRPQHHVRDVDLDKDRYLEIAAAHLVGRESEKPCSTCKEGKGPFRQCIVVDRQDDAVLLGGNCTNCAHGRIECSHDDETLT